MQWFFVVVKLIISFYIGLFIYYPVVAAIFYNFPLSIYWTAKGKTSPMSILVTLIPPIVVFVAMIAIGFFFPSTLNYCLQPPITAGSDFAIFVSMYRIFISKSGRAKAKIDYQIYYGQYSSYKRIKQ
jgi:hypothetical protein